MAKQAGMGDALWLHGYDVSGDIIALGRVGGGNSPLDNTGIDKSGFERMGGKRDGGIESTSWFNPSNNQAHDRFEDLPLTDQIVTYGRGTALGSPGASVVSKQLNYDGTRGEDGSYTFAVSSLANGYGLTWGRQLTAGKRTDTGATNGSSVDLGTASPGAFGLVAFLHVFAFTGTDATVKIQESSDDGAGDPFADVVGGTFTQITSGPTAERIATAAINVERYLRVVTITTGGFSSLIFAVVATRHDTLTVY